MDFDQRSWDHLTNLGTVVFQNNISFSGRAKYPFLIGLYTASINVNEQPSSGGWEGPGLQRDVSVW